MVWICAEERCWIYSEKDTVDGAARQEEKKKAKEEVYGCSERGPAGGWHNGGCQVLVTPNRAARVVHSSPCLLLDKPD